MKKFVLIVPFESDSSMGGAVLVDSRIFSYFSEQGEVALLSIEQLAPTLMFKVRNDRIQLFRIALRMLHKREAYNVAKFRYQEKAYGELLSNLREVINQGDDIVTSGWISILAASDAGLKVKQHYAHNVEHQISLSYSNFYLRILNDWRRLRDFEISLYGKVDNMYTLSRIDNTRLKENGLSNTEVFTVLSPNLNYEESQIKGTIKIGFIGSMSWPPNRLAFDRLQNIILPILQRSGFSFKVTVAGSGTDELTSNYPLEKLGRVHLLDDFYSKIDIVFITRELNEVTGISIKALEALEKGKIVIGDMSTMEPFIHLPNAYAFTEYNEILDIIITIAPLSLKNSDS